MSATWSGYRCLRGELTVKRAADILLWELASALTPSVVGGSAVASFICRNGELGHRLATVMSTAP